MVLFGLRFLYGMFYSKVWLWSCFPFGFVLFRWGVWFYWVFGQLKVNSLLRSLGFGWFLLRWLCGEMVLISSLGGCLEGFVSIYFDVFPSLCSIIGLGFVLLEESFNSMSFISCMNFGQSWEVLIGVVWRLVLGSFLLFYSLILGCFGNRFCFLCSLQLFFRILDRECFWCVL